ncbi:Hint domain-containing protein [Shimia abyssi]|uniref:Hint domain-containing protein n=1 Tax=Shimia abyssi TaxID=1662395 RepID=A0A2P8FFJ7_9RHOB|nr:Hint domain-containing protein [Shimia abyssi]PSL20482.1 Hint domain-containing protein [Shimia abyssi]
MPTPYLSELKYLGGANLDFIEIAVDAGTDVSDIVVTVYRANGTVRSTNALLTLTSTNAGRDIYVINTATSPTFNGLSKSGGVSLSENGTVFQFVSFDDAAPIVATAGPADGITSDQIGMAGAGESLETLDGGASYQVQTDPSEGTIPCFLGGTLIETEDGPVPVERLRAGGRVRDAFGGFLRVRQVLSRQVTLASAICNPRLRPVRIAAGALGPGVPERDLFVSRQHRVLVQSKIAERMFDAPHVLIAAHRFLEADDVDLAPVTREFRYYHLLLERHGVVIADGAPCESFLIAPGSMGAISRDARAKVMKEFPKARHAGYCAKSAAMVPDARRQKRLVQRHLKNRKAFVNGELVQRRQIECTA